MTIRVPTLALGIAELRAPRATDAAALARHADDREVWRNLRDRFPHPYRVSDAERWLHELPHDPRAAIWVIATGGAAIGVIGLHPGDDVHRFDAELGFWLGRASWGRGIATAAVREVAEYGLRHLDLQRIHALVFAWNPASGRVLAKAGFEREAILRDAVHKDGTTLDAELWARTARRVRENAAG